MFGMLQDAPTKIGRVASLHLHPEIPGAPFRTVESIRVVEAKGIEGNPRYFGRRNREGQPSKRQVTLIEREQIAEHAAALNRNAIAPGLVRSNIETLGIDLVALLGMQVQIGEAVLSLYAPRDPCEKMNAVCQGLRERMLNNRQGVLAQVIKSGAIRVGDEIRPMAR
jgi:MOSC domain-containing protein YiiM